MNRNQVLVVSACLLLCVGLYLFTDIKKPQKEQQAISQPTEHEDHEFLDIEKYIAEVNESLPNDSLKQQVTHLADNKAYSEMAQFYYKMDKPIAVAYCLMKQAAITNSSEEYLRAGDYSSMLIQTAPDEKAHSYLSAVILESYQKAAELDSANNQAKLRLAGAYLENSPQPMQGVSILMNMLKKDSNNTDVLLMLGRFGIVSGQFDKAIERLEKVLYLRPQNSEALLLLAEAYNSKGDKIRAIEYLEQCKKTVSNPELKQEIEKHIQSIKKPNG